MKKEELIQLDLTEWEKNVLFELLSNKSTGKCTFGVMADMLQLRTDLKEGKDITLSQNMFNELYAIIMNPNLTMTIDDKSMKLYNKFKDIKK